MSEFFDTSKVLGTLGDFWYELYSGKEQVSAFLESFLEVQKQIEQETKELTDSLDRHTVPVFRKLYWVPIKLKESEFIASQYPYITYNSGLTYDSGNIYGQKVKKAYKVDVPKEVVSIASVQDRIKENTISITGLVIKNGSFYMDWNPFNTSTVNICDIYNDLGEKIDREATIWLKDVSVDKEDLYNLFGYVLGIKLESSEQYKSLINGLMDTLVNGPSKNSLITILSACTGISATNNKKLKLYSTSDTAEDICGIQITSNLIPGTIDGTYVENKSFSVTSTQEDSFTRIDLPCTGNYTDINEYIFSKGKENCKKITDDCEIATINKLLNRENRQQSKDTEILQSAGGLSTWVRTHRFQ